MRLALLALLLASCARTDKLANIPVQSATLDGWTGASLIVTGGGQIAWAKLHLVEPGGVKLDVPVQIAGGAVGPFMTMSMANTNEGRGEFDLSHVKDAHGDDLLGPYQGWSIDGAMFAGGSYYELENDRRARFKLGGFELSFGMDIFAGQEWLEFDVADAGPVDAGLP
jgi:hypothetical protein